jgi:hypothetical protein
VQINAPNYEEQYMIDIVNESLVSIPEASRLIPGRPHLATIYRWMARGVRGIKLETCLIGGRRFTSQEKVQLFVEHLTAAAAETPRHSRTVKQRTRAAELANSELAKAGW